mgnify:CR=1 FL=1
MNVNEIMGSDALVYSDSGERLERALEAVYRDEDRLTPDQGGVAETNEFCQAVSSRLS